ncbi:MAG: pyridoxal-dependent decarboxylase, partial [Thermoanaerobaculia bacterium]
MLFDRYYRGIAHQVVDAMFDHVETIESRPVVDWRNASELRESVTIGDGGKDPMEQIRFLAQGAIQLHHPSYMGHQVCPPFPTAVIADLVISTLNQSTAVWEMSPVATLVEQEVTRWLARRAGYGDASLGTAVSGGSAANLTGLLAARARWMASAEGTTKRAVVLCSADAHYSIARAASIMGIGHDEVLKVPTDESHRMDPAALESILGELGQQDDRSVMAVVATAGSTATGAFDDLSAIAGICRSHQVWLHVDA